MASREEDDASKSDEGSTVLEEVTFASLVIDKTVTHILNYGVGARQGVTDVLCEACAALNWKSPTAIQRESLPIALKGTSLSTLPCPCLRLHPVGRDIIGLAETGSGKTAAFALPILQALLDMPTRLFALVLTPTRYEDLSYHSASGRGVDSLKS